MANAYPNRTERYRNSDNNIMEITSTDAISGTVTGKVDGFDITMTLAEFRSQWSFVHPGGSGGPVADAARGGYES